MLKEEELSEEINTANSIDITIDYKENGEDGDQVQDNRCPIVALDVPAKKEIPQTGSNTSIISGSLIAGAVVIAVFSFVNYKRNNLK